MNNDYGLGRIAAADDRDRKHLMAAVIADKPVPTYRYLRTGATLDQGATSSCVGHAWVAFLMAAPTMTKDVNPFWLYRAAQDYDEWPGHNYDGSSVRGGAKYLQQEGRLSSYVWAFEAQTVADFILGGHGSVVAGTNFYDQMFRPDKHGFVQPFGRIVGGHAYLAVGYSRTRGVFRFLNSWGTAFGDKGRFWMLGEHVDRLIREDGEACAAIEQKVQS